jgi:hypothetical protein
MDRCDLLLCELAPIWLKPALFSEKLAGLEFDLRIRRQKRLTLC